MYGCHSRPLLLKIRNVMECTEKKSIRHFFLGTPGCVVAAVSVDRSLLPLLFFFCLFQKNRRARAREPLTSPQKPPSIQFRLACIAELTSYALPNVVLPTDIQSAIPEIIIWSHPAADGTCDYLVRYRSAYADLCACIEGRAAETRKVPIFIT
jgi:hypothetical protein